MFEERIAELNNSIAAAALAGGNDGKRTYTVEEIQNILEIGKATAYRLIKRG